MSKMITDIDGDAIGVGFYDNGLVVVGTMQSDKYSGVRLDREQLTELIGALTEAIDALPKPKQPGQRAFEAYATYGFVSADEWHTLSPARLNAWAAVEAAVKARA